MVHEEFMAEALRLARRGLGRTSPNPAVGALIVRNGRVIGRGYHRRAGLPHAEIEAMKGLGRRDLRGATLYVTLEPCCTEGRTPPCTSAIIASGMGRVVTGARDPNPKVSGRGIALLRKAGIEVVEGVLEDKAAALNDWFEKFITTGLPFVRLKLAASLDGRIAAKTGRSKWITGPEARRYVHRLRATADAVMVGVNTALADDPALTVRSARGRNPARVLLDSAFRTPLGARIFSNPAEGVFVFTTSRAPASKVRSARAMGVKVFSMGRRGARGVDLRRVMKKLGGLSIASVLIEGGGVLAASALGEGLVDRVSYFMAPIFLGGCGVPSVGSLGVTDPAEALALEDLRVRRVGRDILVEGRPAEARR